MVDSVSFSPDGALLATGGWDGMVILWDVLTREKIIAFGHTDAIRSVSFSPDGTTLAAGGEDGTILLWNVEKTESDQGLRRWTSRVGRRAIGQAVCGFSVRSRRVGLYWGSRILFGYHWWRDALSHHVTTNANGRARSTLTLGFDPGPNTVSATVEGL